MSPKVFFASYCNLASETGLKNNIEDGIGDTQWQWQCKYWIMDLENDIGCFN